MSEGHSERAQSCHPCQRDKDPQQRPSPVPPRGRGVLAAVIRLWRYFCFLVWRNRFAVAVASLVWLIWRSGTQPRRLAYPCQQAAAANLGFLAVLFIPEAARRHAARHRRTRRAFALATGSVALAGVLTLLISAGVAVYSEWLTQQAALNIPAPPNPPPPATVGITKTTLSTLTAADIETMVRDAVAKAGGLSDIIHPGDLVSIKPNLVNDMPWDTYPENGVTTDPRVVLAVVKLAKEAGAGMVRIVEGSAGPFDWYTSDPDELGRGITWLAYEKCGYDADGNHQFDLDPTVWLWDLNDAGEGGLIPRPITITPRNTAKITLGNNGVIRTEYYVPRLILKPDQGGSCDVLISVPTFKNHGNGSFTLGLKNRVGCAPSDIYHDTVVGHENQMKRDLVHRWGSGDPFPRNVAHNNPGPPANENECVNYTLVDLNLVRPNDFVVVDGLVGITDGPTGTTKISPLMRMIMAGADSVAVDSVGALCMNYDPLASRYIGWAWNRGLGNRDTAQITVVGDHVAQVRRQFPCGYGDAACCDLTSPTIGNMSPDEGAEVFADVPVTGSGLSADVVKAELSVRLTGGENLMVNGDFEAGATGWQEWRAPWGSGETWEFDNTEPGHLGTQCLRLSSGHASFGVYQEVQVTPGKTYRIDAYWKGQKLAVDGADNWYEVLILDGPWDYGQADGNPNTPPYDDPSEPVFNEMYGYDSHTYSMPADFGWIWTHDQNDTPVDTMDRDGLRTASGNVMTVVLKAGAAGGATGSSGWFDDISLVEVDTDERLVATLPYPMDPFEIIWPAAGYVNGNYEMRLTVYDAALNEASILRHVTRTDIPAPMIALSTDSLTPSVNLGADPPDDVFTVWNSGIDVLEYRIDVDQSWLWVTPTSGSSDGQEDAIAVSYDTTGLLAGTHNATITISDNGSAPYPAVNSPQTIQVTLSLQTVKADFDGDCDVDQEDFGALQACLAGEMIAVSPECLRFDLQKDSDVDWADVALFRACFGGPNVCADPACDESYP